MGMPLGAGRRAFFMPIFNEEDVLANTVQFKDHDGRISNANKQWAKTIPVVPNADSWGGDRNCYFVVDRAHTGLVDLFVTHFRKEL